MDLSSPDRNRNRPQASDRDDPPRQCARSSMIWRARTPTSARSGSTLPDSAWLCMARRRWANHEDGQLWIIWGQTPTSSLVVGADFDPRQRSTGICAAHQSKCRIAIHEDHQIIRIGQIARDAAHDPDQWPCVCRAGSGAEYQLHVQIRLDIDKVADHRFIEGRPVPIQSVVRIRSWPACSRIEPICRVIAGAS